MTTPPAARPALIPGRVIAGRRLINRLPGSGAWRCMLTDAPVEAEFVVISEARLRRLEQHGVGRINPAAGRTS